MTPERTTRTSYWLWADRRIRISYNTCGREFGSVAAFLKIDVLDPRGGSLPGSPAGHISVVLKGWDKLRADGDPIGYAQSLLGNAVPASRRQTAGDPNGRQLALF